MSITTGILTGGANAHQTTSEEANAWATDFISEGIVGSVGSTNGIAPTTGSFSINAQGTPDMTVAVGSGTAYVTGTPSSQASQTFRVKNSATSNVTISANSSGSTKYDWVYIQLDATKLNTPNSAADDVATLVTSRSSSASSDDGTPPTYGYPLAVVTVANGATTITNSNIRDLRTQSTISSTTAGTSNDWYSTSLSPNTVTALGNRSYSLVFNSTDLTTYISNGMRLKLPRTVTPPTYMGGAFNGSSHYFTKTSPTGTLSTVTNNFTIMCHVEPTAYATAGIAGRSDATPNNGLMLGMTSTGQITVFVRNGGGSNYRILQTTQSLPLNKKSHIAASWTSGTVVIYLDGVSVPLLAPITAGTAPTVAGTGGDFSIGRQGAFAGEYFPGYISSVGVFDAVLSAATIRQHMNQALTGSETNCIGAWNLNNAATDASASANNLTATGGVGYTARSPMNATEYAIVMANSFSTNTTLTVQVPEGYSLPTTGGIGTVSYSTQKTPYGFPGQRGKWTLSLCMGARASTSAGIAVSTVTNPGGINLSLPVGEWTLGYQMGVVDSASGPVAYLAFAAGLSTSASSISDYELMSQSVLTNSSNNQTQSYLVKSKQINSTTSTPWYFVVKPLTAAVTHTLFTGYDASLSSDIGLITAENAYL